MILAWVCPFKFNVIDYTTQYLLEVTCPEYSPVDGISVSGSGTSYMTTLILKCEQRYFFEDGFNTKNITCLGDGTWTDPNPTCYGEY